MRGDYLGLNPAKKQGYGSPPRAWGLLESLALEVGLDRFTPTCVGTTVGQSRPFCCAAVHPHVRGDYRARVDVLDCDLGSPPRAWGLRGQAEEDGQRHGFTPTCVGTTDDDEVPVLLFPVHPHVRGDYYEARRAVADTAGSPPRAWGLLCRVWDLGRLLRFTPTCVGTTCLAVSSICFTAVHPHVRGDYP